MDNAGLFLFVFGLSNKSSLADFLMITGAEYVVYAAVFLNFFAAIRGGAKEKKALLLSILSLGIAFIMIRMVRIFYIEPRPFVAFGLSPLIDHKPDPSFPSQHTSMMATITLAYYYYKSKLAPLLLVLLIWVGLSRVYVGVHYPLDILGGIIIGLISVYVAWEIKKGLKRYI